MRTWPWTLAGVLLLLAAGLVWLSVTADWAMAGGEARAAQLRGEVPRFWPVTWGEWQKGAGSVSAPERAPERIQAAKIAEYRAGRAEPSFFYTLNFYEAKYVLT